MHTLVRYAIASGAAGAALGLTRLIWPVIEPTLSPLFPAAVVVSAWYGGLGPGLFATGLAVLTKLYFFAAPVRSLRVDDSVTLLHLALFVALACLISSLTGAKRRSQAENARLIAREQAARAEAEAANRAKDVFLAMVSHELRTPLQAMANGIQILRQAETDAAHVASILPALERNLAGQTRLINDLLEVSRIVSGKLDLALAAVPLGPLIETAVATARAASPAPHVVLHLDLDPKVGPVLGDAARLEQVVCNLVSNALKFTPPGGRVQIRLESSEDCARIVVADTGRGIPRDLLPHVFDEFRQAAHGRDAGGQGLGLGLAIVRRLVELHHGRVAVDSDGPGRGATFVVELPLAERHRAPLVANR